MTRIGNVFIALAGVFLGILCLSTPPSFIWGLLTALVFSFSVAAGNVENDLLDIETDKINRLNRALPSGRVTIKQAKYFAFILYSMSLSFSFFLPNLGYGIGFLLFVTLTLYNRKLKATPIIGNLTVGLLCASAVIYPALVFELEFKALHSCVFAFVFTWLRETVKDLEDIKGDQFDKLITTAVYFGEPRTRTLIFILWILCIASLSTPYFIGDYGPIFLFLGSTLVGLCTLILGIQFFREKLSPHHFSTAIKICMLAGMISIITDLFFT